MPKGNTNTHACRKIEIIGMLAKQHAMSAPQIAKKLKLHVRSIHRYLRELRTEKHIFRRYQLFGEGARRPTFYYSLRRGRV
jgi:predicted ArsR family transcriptional regulator